MIQGKDLKPVIEWLPNGCDPLDAARELELLAQKEQPAPSAPKVSDKLRERVMGALADVLWDAYACSRCWSAWDHNTMTENDFTLITSDQDRISEIAEVVIHAVLTSAPEDRS